MRENMIPNKNLSYVSRKEVSVTWLESKCLNLSHGII